MAQTSNTPTESMYEIDNQGITYEDIRSIRWQRHSLQSIGDNDIM
jgi:hypothetical protein